jgi:serine/threonine-protein kinase
MSAVETADSGHAQPAKLLAPGDVIDGRYRIESFLGGGGMASVYRATHVVLEQAVAIKVISPVIRQLPGMAQRFLREARAATQLKSEHVARVTDVGTMADGAPYMVMEYLDGCDLDAILEQGEDIPVEEAVDFVLQACEALAEVHGLGIVHRDLKPANLFLTKAADGLPCVKLIDFGISRTDSPLAQKDLAALTQPDTVMGSPRYMSPEQMESCSKADSRSDIYGVGAVLYELLTRKAPHEGETFLDIYAAATLAPPAVPSSLRADVPKALDQVILKCLEVDPANRYEDTAALAMALAPFGPEGSLARAEAIIRILESARARTQVGAGNDDAVASDEGSRVRKRVSSSAHALRQKRRSRSMLILAALTLGGLAYGGQNLYNRGVATGVASTATAASPPAGPPARIAPAPAVAEIPSATTETTAASAAAPGYIVIGDAIADTHAAVGAAASGAPATADEQARAAEAERARRRAPAVRPSARAARPVFVPPAPALAAPPPPQPAPSWPAAPAAAPTHDERKLFEERK